MELLTRKPGEVDWAMAPGVLEGLYALLGSEREALLFAADPVRDREGILAAVRLFREAGGRTGRLRIAGRCHAADWIEPLRALGVSEFALAADLVYAWGGRWRLNGARPHAGDRQGLETPSHAGGAS
ncbi:MAG: hypothetical protein EHM19_04710 [Candidatus Latescibacterota bacterium]|nr:MAG: hypothetical protein EHM19_04710 [Candidatus Latescibacterota bacterium]